jgi:hypothetical protein
MGIPLWVSDPGWEAIHQADIFRALAEGLTFRHLPRTMRDTLSWDLARGGPATPGLTPEVEQLLGLAAITDHAAQDRTVPAGLAVIAGTGTQRVS